MAASSSSAAPHSSSTAAWEYASELEEGNSPMGASGLRHSTLLSDFGTLGNQELPARFLEHVERLRDPDLADLQKTLSREAAYCYFSDEFDAAAILFKRALHVAEHRRDDAENIAAIQGSYAAAQHHLRRFDDAIDLYERSLISFRSLIPSGRLARWLQGGILEKRMDFLEHRILRARKGETPPRGEFLDPEGKLRYDGKEFYGKIQKAHSDREEAQLKRESDTRSATLDL